MSIGIEKSEALVFNLSKVTLEDFLELQMENGSYLYVRTLPRFTSWTFDEQIMPLEVIQQSQVAAAEKLQYEMGAEPDYRNFDAITEWFDRRESQYKGLNVVDYTALQLRRDMMVSSVNIGETPRSRLNPQQLWTGTCNLVLNELSWMASTPIVNIAAMDRSEAKMRYDIQTAVQQLQIEPVSRGTGMEG